MWDYPSPCRERTDIRRREDVLTKHERRPSRTRAFASPAAYRLPTDEPRLVSVPGLLPSTLSLRFDSKPRAAWRPALGLREVLYRSPAHQFHPETHDSIESSNHGRSDLPAATDLRSAELLPAPEVRRVVFPGRVWLPIYIVHSIARRSWPRLPHPHSHPVRPRQLLRSHPRLPAPLAIPSVSGSLGSLEVTEGPTRRSSSLGMRSNTCPDWPEPRGSGESTEPDCAGLVPTKGTHQRSSRRTQDLH